MIAISPLRNVEFGMWNQRIEFIPNSEFRFPHSDTRLNHGDNLAPLQIHICITRRRQY